MILCCDIINSNVVLLELKDFATNGKKIKLSISCDSRYLCEKIPSIIKELQDKTNNKLLPIKKVIFAFNDKHNISVKRIIISFLQGYLTSSFSVENLQ